MIKLNPVTSSAYSSTSNISPPAHDSDLGKPLNAQDLSRRLRRYEIHQQLSAHREKENASPDGPKEKQKDPNDFYLKPELPKGSTKANTSHHPRTPPSRTTKRQQKENDDSPNSQVIVSGDCTPGSEGVKRADRRDVHHWPGAQEETPVRRSRSGCEAEKNAKS